MSSTQPNSDSGSLDSPPRARVIGINGNIVSIETDGGPIMKNEVAYVVVGNERLKSEVLRIYGKFADLQVFEETHGVRCGDPVELSGRLLSVVLGPGMLGVIFDGLQSPLTDLAERDGFFLKRGQDLYPLDQTRRWDFTANVKVGDKVRAGHVLGTVPERNITHKLMAPFDLRDAVEVVAVYPGPRTVAEAVLTVKDAAGKTHDWNMTQTWAVRRSIPEMLLKQRVVERQFPSQPLTTTMRIVDTFFPIARGGTACIPGPFGAGKTVTQGLLARYSTIDVVIVVACGERAGEVVETIHEFAEMIDPRTGGKLMDRTIIICNTSSMPVAAREASIYTGITLGEYYRQMGLDVLLLADSTSRWAQAMRETSGRLEEIPGEEAFPAYLDSAIKSVYERAGVLRLQDGSTGSLTLVGSVSPAGGNFEEPVTQSTLGTVKCFLGLSYERAYKRFYPAIDPLISWSRYREQLQPYFDRHLAPDWTKSVTKMHSLLRQGNDILRMMQVTGEEGITTEDFVTYQKALFLDMVYLQQDAFDKVDVTVPEERQKAMFLLCKRLIDRQYQFRDKEQVREFFTRLTGLFKNLNYSASGSDDYRKYISQIEDLERKYVGGES
ncbi:MAG: V-type ATP synthase subunit A [Planctomycetaceae bacterium]|nr:V-type ATP synthase subunit A [Planctomycetaceae bacterium]